VTPAGESADIKITLSIKIPPTDELGGDKLKDICAKLPPTGTTEVTASKVCHCELTNMPGGITILKPVPKYVN
jgi:hypothetical protein